ncbi:hypothetical protein L9F63_002513, partial [Diploptera punctata]
VAVGTFYLLKVTGKELMFEAEELRSSLCCYTLVVVLFTFKVSVDFQFLWLLWEKLKISKPRDLLATATSVKFWPFQVFFSIQIYSQYRLYFFVCTLTFELSYSYYTKERTHPV